MVEIDSPSAVAPHAGGPATGTLPLAPRNPLPYRQQIKALRYFIEGHQRLRDAGGPVNRIVLGPRWLVPQVLMVTSPQGARDVLGRPDAVADRGGALNMIELRRLMGGNLLNLPHEHWLPRRRTLQPMFTKQHVPRYAGHMATAAQDVADSWDDGATVDLDAACRALTLRALGRSVFGLDLDERADDVGPALRASLSWISDRSTHPVKLPQWVPTPAQRRAKAGNARLHQLAAEILTAVRADPDRDAPLVRALIDARDPDTGLRLTDDEICHELVLFMLAGHDTTSTTLCYSLWALGCHPEIEARVHAEVAALGERTLTPEDVPHLEYTVRVLHESLRLCPPGAGTPRMLNEEIVVDGYRVEAGTMAMVNFYVMHRDPALWDDPLTFDPDRFNPDRSAGRSRWQYLPFGGGPRSCVGDHFAMLEATLALATLVRAAHVESLHDDFPVETPFTVVAAEPIPARITKRRSTP
ncbi:cytochrome P450 [Mycolicibacterium mageritense DSM 44476 = CIP 104973]|uniref:Cytochrome P450 n=2 Tax=Mycolicibacterium TaxID=1866885 RepID=A0AAI8TVA0_MYCME|nr:cytochrome P450 [Mycolicibacterium mageritense]MBN3457134.1 cytochrome P450 [Mycobacterium sp. DSM 3803]OKH77258.1 cytochrome P450 [Mycobacterium sp. SWH-M3]MCC9180776.1 cytochrome P450 [Mycolicibacterium mageritense]TXI58297.1 MAG: cytochrome P450 [Mycolicibacterium mageritense]CDO21049.1 cytochrome P450 [Mycolicibacterium mageritense DSM 44476 = CIP 104973]